MKKKTPPFSLRLTFEERARLEELAGDMPLGAYIRRNHPKRVKQCFIIQKRN